MSSAMMTRMFGFCGCWAKAGSPEIVPTAVKAVRASRPDRMLRAKLMAYSPRIFIASYFEQPAAFRSNRGSRGSGPLCLAGSGRPFGSATGVGCRQSALLALMTGLLHFRKDAVEVVGLRRL